MATSMGMGARRRRFQPGDMNEECNSMTLDYKISNAKFGYYDSIMIWILIIFTYVVMFMFVSQRFHLFPDPQFSGKGKPLHNFYEDLAREHLETVTSFGKRPSGSYANEKLTADYIFSKLKKIQETSHVSKSVDVDIQNVSGTFHLYFINSDFYSVYRNVKNHVAMIGPKSGADDSVLINCHFDTSVDSIGAGDDMASCAVMLEIARSIAQSDETLLHNIIFLFNGAEENILQGSHGFITQHRWADSIKAFVNLDSAGAGGWEIVFQTGPQHPWLIKAYIESSPYPSASVINQEIFELGIVPADTDFRIFRDFGKIPGLDIAYISNGYVYHTAYDTADRIQPGCLQRAGENLRGLLMTMAQSPKLIDPGDEKHGSMVFYDLVGLFVIQYPKRIGAILNCFVSFCVYVMLWKKLSTTKPVFKKAHSGIKNGTSDKIFLNGKVTHNKWQHIQYMGVAFIVSVATPILTFLVVVGCIAAPLCFGGYSLFWFSNTINIFTVYASSALLTALSFHQYLKKKYFRDLDEEYLEMLFFDISLFNWAVATVVMTMAGLAMTYIAMLWILFPMLIRVSFQKFCGLNWTTKKIPFLIVHICGQLVPLLTMTYIIYMLFILFVPIFGRIEGAIIPDMAISVLATISVLLCAQYMFGLVYVCDVSGLLRLLAGGVIMSILAVVFTPIGFPFSSSKEAPALERVTLMHMKREFYAIDGTLNKTDSGIWNCALDYTIRRENHLAKYVPEFASSPYLQSEGAPYFGAALSMPVGHVIDPRLNLYIPASPPNPEQKVQVKLLLKSKISADTVRIKLQVKGPDHMTYYVRPKPGVELQGWSLLPGKPKPVAMGTRDEKTYFVFSATPELSSTPYELYIDLQSSSENSMETRELVDIAFCGFYIHGKEKITKEMENIIVRLPDWSVPYFAFVATYSSYVF